MRYGGNVFGMGVEEKQMPSGVVCEALEDFNASQFYKSTPRLVAALMTEKGATDVYNKFVKEVMSKKKGMGTFNFKGVQKVVQSFGNQFEQTGLAVVLCNRRASAGGQSVTFVRWIEYVDLSQQQDYTPEESYDPALEPCCTCSLM